VSEIPLVFANALYKICAARLLAEAASAHAELAKARAEYDTKLKAKPDAHHAAPAAERKGLMPRRFAECTGASAGMPSIPDRPQHCS
jgi:hypothetical protein